MSKKNYYEILEINKDCSQDDIKKAFRKMASKHHPDKNPTKIEEATKKFQEIQRAYEVLSNPEKREHYDRFGEEENGEMGSNGFPGGFNPFETFFNQSNRTNRKEEKNKILTINITLKDLYNGVNKKIMITSKNKCIECNYTIRECNSCNGRGIKNIIRQMGPMIQQMQVPCNECNQTGNIMERPKKKCDLCENGLVNEKFEYVLDINKNSDYKNLIIIKNKGDYDLRSNKRNDIQIRLIPGDNKFEIKNHDLLYLYEINIKDALCVNNIYMDHPNGKKYILSCGEIIKNNDIKIVKHLGLPSEYSYGNLVIKFEYIYPKNILKIDNYNDFINKSNEEKEGYENTAYLIDNNDFKDNEEENGERQENIQCNQS